MALKVSESRITHPSITFSKSQQPLLVMPGEDLREHNVYRTDLFLRNRAPYVTAGTGERWGGGGQNVSSHWALLWEVLGEVPTCWEEFAPG